MTKDKELLYRIRNQLLILPTIPYQWSEAHYETIRRMYKVVDDRIKYSEEDARKRKQHRKKSSAKA